MKPLTRRAFLKKSMAASAAAGIVRFTALGQDTANKSAADDAVHIAVVGLGGIDVVGGVGGRGRQLINTMRKTPGARIVALCDVDQAVLDNGVQLFKQRGESVAAYRDIRKLLEDKAVDAVVVATPNHWHALASIWACQAGKDVYVEKPFAYNIWEGRQIVAAARQYNRIVQVGTQNRSSDLLREAFESLRGGQLGAIKSAHALVYRPRESLGSVSSPTSIPPTVDYELWCGPAPKAPLMRKQLHYEWHWFWATGNGEMGNNGIHVIDICRWALGMNQVPPRVVSLGGRFAFDDCGQTANTQVAFFDYKPAPLICEVRNVRKAKGTDAAGKFRDRDGGIVIDCEGGYFAGDATGATFFDGKGSRIKELQPAKSTDLEVTHMSRFLKAVKSRKPSDLAAEALEGHLSTACCHLANLSYRLGVETPPAEIQERTRNNAELLDAFERCREHLRVNGVDLAVTPAVLGPWLDFDPVRERIIGEFADKATPFLMREYREPFVVPKV
jgi:predicted dehydrogenase